MAKDLQLNFSCLKDLQEIYMDETDGEVNLTVIREYTCLITLVGTA